MSTRLVSYTKFCCPRIGLMRAISISQRMLCIEIFCSAYNWIVSKTYQIESNWAVNARFRRQNAYHRLIVNGLSWVITSYREVVPWILEWKGAFSALFTFEAVICLRYPPELSSIVWTWRYGSHRKSAMCSCSSVAPAKRCSVKPCFLFIIYCTLFPLLQDSCLAVVCLVFWPTLSYTIATFTSTFTGSTLCLTDFTSLQKPSPFLLGTTPVCVGIALCLINITVQQPIEHEGAISDGGSP